MRAALLSHPEPAEAKLNWHLAFDGPYDRAIKEKKVGVTPFINLRRAFPGLLPPSALLNNAICSSKVGFQRLPGSGRSARLG